MATQLFEEKNHATFYKKYRFSPQENLQAVIFSYLEEKGNSFHLAVDVGCGSGQSTQVLAKRFEKVVGVDISEAQIREARRDTHPPNVSYLVSPAEELPFEDGSVDLLTGFVSVHWFDIPRFMKEVDRVLKASGCIIVSTYNQHTQLCYKDQTEKLTEIFKKAHAWLLTFADARVKLVLNDYQEIFDSLPFRDKKRVTGIMDKVSMSVADLMGYLQSLSMYQSVLKLQPEAAKSLLQNTEGRLLEAMGVTSRDTQVELQMKHVCILACKNAHENC